MGQLSVLIYTVIKRAVAWDIKSQIWKNKNILMCFKSKIILNWTICQLGFWNRDSAKNSKLKKESYSKISLSVVLKITFKLEHKQFFFLIIKVTNLFYFFCHL